MTTKFTLPWNLNINFLNYSDINKRHWQPTKTKAKEVPVRNILLCRSRKQICKKGAASFLQEICVRWSQKKEWLEILKMLIYHENSAKLHIPTDEKWIFRMNNNDKYKLLTSLASVAQRVGVSSQRGSLGGGQFWVQLAVGANACSIPGPGACGRKHMEVSPSSFLSLSKNQWKKMSLGVD